LLQGKTLYDDSHSVINEEVSGKNRVELGGGKCDHIVDTKAD
jgi:hypothetical protein